MATYYGNKWTGLSDHKTKRTFRPYAVITTSSDSTTFTVNVGEMGIQKTSRANCHADLAIYCKVTANITPKSGKNPITVSKKDWNYKLDKEDIRMALTSNGGKMVFAKTSSPQTLKITLSGYKNKGVYKGSSTKTVLTVPIPKLNSVDVNYIVEGENVRTDTKYEGQKLVLWSPSYTNTKVIYWVGDNGNTYSPNNAYNDQKALTLTASFANGGLVYKNKVIGSDSDITIWVKHDDGWHKVSQMYRTDETSSWKKLKPYIFNVSDWDNLE